MQDSSDHTWLIIYCAPCLLGDDARGLLRLPPIRSLEQRVQLEIAEVHRIGPDLRIHARPSPGNDRRELG